VRRARRHRLLATSLLGALVALSGACRRLQPAEGSIAGAISVEGRERTYLLHVPDSAVDPSPLIVALHGRGGDGISQEQLSGLSALADREGFVVVYPDGVGRSWNDGRPGTPAADEDVDDVAFIAALIDHLASTAGVDEARVYVAGMSNGALMTQRLACDLGDRVAAIGPVAGLLTENIAGSCPLQRPMPAMIFLGTDDALMPYEGGEIPGAAVGEVRSGEETFAFWAERAGCSGEAVRTTLPDGEEDDGTTTIEHRHGACEDGAAVILYEVQEGGHTWPGGWQYASAALVGATSRDIDASALLWEFFRTRHLD
jgi:polyhydroxybutyrate depolymerase